jgi:prefoldin subunit 5
MSSDDKAMVSAIGAASVEIDRAIERMRRDQAEIEKLKAETRAMLKELTDATSF